MKTNRLLIIMLLLCTGTALSQAEPEAEQERKAGERMVLTIKDVEYAFRWCPAGTFMMGSPEDEGGTEPDALGMLWEIQHQVTLTHGFWMLETEVTQGMWESVMGSNPSQFKGTKRPVETISWFDCQEYIKKLNELLAGTPGAPVEFKFSLPTEAQWEYACRAETDTAYHFGNILNNDQANFGHSIFEKPLKGTSEVGSYSANAWGLHDMHGNVFEWCLDWFDVYPNRAVTDPIQSFPTSKGLLMGKTERVVRSGDWNSVAWGCRSASRATAEPTKRSNAYGFRFVLVGTK